MRTNITLDEALVSELLAFSGEKTKTAAVAAAVREQIRRAKLKKLSEILENIEVDEDALKAQEKADFERARLLEEIGAEHGR